MSLLLCIALCNNTQDAQQQAVVCFKLYLRVDYLLAHTLFALSELLTVGKCHVKYSNAAANY